MEKMKVTNSARSGASIYLYGDIGEAFGGISANEFRLALEEIGENKPIVLHIDSAGGEFFAAITMYGLLKQRPGKISVIVDGRAASAASIIAMAGATISMATNAWMMIHEVHSGGNGTADDFRKEADRIDALNKQIVDIYASRWNGTVAELRQALHDETWLDAKQTVAAGLADEVIETMAVAAHVDPTRFGYLNVPEQLLVAAAPAHPRLERAKDEVAKLFAEKEEIRCELK